MPEILGKVAWFINMAHKDDFVCVCVCVFDVMYPGEYDVSDVTLSVHPHPARESNPRPLGY